VVRSYATTFDAPPAGKAVKPSSKTTTKATTRFDPRALGPIVDIPWGELREMLDAVWGQLPRR
jgi:hypothetical protein